jgi:colanic acid biosynthesis glycosyl transferase WcaI
VKLCILTQYFPPEMGAPQARLSELAERLIDRGWEVEALTALPNYPAGAVQSGYDPWRPVVEQVGRVRTARVPLYPASRGFARRLGCYFSFAGSASLLGPRLCARPDLLWVESPPLFTGLAAMYLSRRWSVPYVLNVSDLWPEAAVRMGVIRPGLATRAAEGLERLLYRSAAAVTGQSDEIIAAVRGKAPDVPAAVITNGVDPARFDAANEDAGARGLLGDQPGPVFLYAGLFGLAQGLDQILDLASALPAATPGRFVLVGDGPERERLQRRITDEAITRVRLLPAQPRDKIPALLAAADAAVVTLGLEIPGSVPSKIYEAMAARLPILLVAAGEAARRVADADCGITAPPGDAAALLRAFLELAGDASLRARLGARGRLAAETTYNRALIADRLDATLRAALS